MNKARDVPSGSRKYDLVSAQLPCLGTGLKVSPRAMSNDQGTKTNFFVPGREFSVTDFQPNLNLK